MLELFRQKKKQRNNWLISSGFPTEVTPGAEVLVLFAEACTLEAGEARVCGYLIGKCRLRTDARNGLPGRAGFTNHSQINICCCEKLKRVISRERTTILISSP